MPSLTHCFVDDVVELVELLYTGPSGAHCYEFGTLKELDAHLSGPDNTDYTCVTMSVSPRSAC